MPASDPSFLQNSSGLDSVRKLIEARALAPHFQPIVRLGDGLLFAHEALIRTPADCPWRSPDALFAAARAEGLTIALELECVRLALYRWTRGGGRGKLFVNLSAGALVTALAQRDIESILSVMQGAGVSPSDVVVELTEHEHVKDFDALASAVRRLRRHRAGVALDDFGDGRSSLRLWSELKPEIVKIDKYFTHNLAQHPEKLQTLRALHQISQTLGSQLVAEGIETPEDLRLVRDLDIHYGQGWLLGRPQWPPLLTVPSEALDVLRSRDVAVFPERRRNAQQRATPAMLLDEVPAIHPAMSNQELFDIFTADARLSAVAIVEDGRPQGIVGRQQFVDRFAKPYVKELFGRKACTLFANMAPRILDMHAGIDELTAILTSEDQRYLSEGIIITEHGRYRGLGSGEQLVRTVTEARIEAARHANPLTLLPGNIPITQHIERLLRAGREFVVCYGDLNHFKPFNDLYGYWRGDEMIRLASRCVIAQADARRDFVGHVGGDDFIVLFQSDDWEARCEAIVSSFDLLALELYDETERAAGGVMAEDRHGVQRFHPLTTMTIGAFKVAARSEFRAEQIASGAAVAKRRGKAASARVYTVDSLR